MATRTVKKSTKKGTKRQDANEVKLSESLNKIKDTAINLNSQVMDTAADVIDDLKVNGEQMRENAVKNVKEAIEKINDTVTFENLKDTAKTVNKYTLKTADELVDVAIENGEKWQGIASKAVNGGLKMAAKNQDIVFTALETMKDQLADSALRLKKLLRTK